MAKPSLVRQSDMSGNLIVVFLHHAPCGRRGDFIADNQIRIGGGCREIS
jgi:hypothetical protein